MHTFSKRQNGNIYKYFVSIALILAIAFTFSGCFGPGTADYRIDLSYGYSISRVNSENIFLTKEKKGVDTTEIISYDIVVYGIIVGIKYNERYVICAHSKETQKAAEFREMSIEDVLKNEGSTFNFIVFDMKNDRLLETFTESEQCEEYISHLEENENFTEWRKLS